MKFDPIAERRRIWAASRTWRHTPPFRLWSQKDEWVDQQVATLHVGRIVAFQRERRS